MKLERFIFKIHENEGIFFMPNLNFERFKEIDVYFIKKEMQ